MAEDLFDRALVLVMDGGQTLLANGGEVFRVQQNAATISVNIRLMLWRPKCRQTSASNRPATAATGTSASVPPNR